MLGCRSTGPDAEGEQRCRAGQGRCVAPAGKESGDYFGAKWVNWVWARRREGGGRRMPGKRKRRVKSGRLSGGQHRVSDNKD